MSTLEAVRLPSAERSCESVALEELDAFLKDLASQHIDHLIALLTLVADNLEKSKTPETIEKVIQLIREEVE